MERESREQSLRIEGMTCAGCAQAVERALSQVHGVKTASVNLLTEEARVKHTGLVSPEALVAAVEAAGYKAALIASPPERRIKLGIEGRRAVDAITRNVEALNLVPYTKFTYQAYMVGVNQEVTFDALGLYNEDGEIVDHTCLSAGAHGKKTSGNLTVINADDKGVCC